jgi:hypothetical protein
VHKRFKDVEMDTFNTVKHAERWFVPRAEHKR